MSQIETQRKGSGFEKAENFLNRCAVGLLATRLALRKTKSGVKDVCGLRNKNTVVLR